jgi:hypothetical protein
MASDVGVPSKNGINAGVSEPAKAPKQVVVPAKVPSPKAEPSKLDAAKPASAKAKSAKAVPAAVAKPAVKAATEPKAAKSAAEPVSAADPAHALRGVAEQSLAQARTAFAKSQEATQRLAQGFEASGQVVQSGLKEMQMRMAEAVEAQTHAAFNYFKAITQAHSLSELIDLQSSELRQGMQRTLGEAKEMSSLAQAIAAKAAEPVRKAIDLAVDTARPSH